MPNPTLRKEQLGMAHGTANARLRKIIMFELAKKCNEDVCFKCGKKIETIDEFTIEHKEPWEGRDVSLFWDINNIAFSHRKCNRPHDMIRYSQRIEPPENKGWCRVCKDFIPKVEMSKDKNRWHGMGTLCLKHKQEYMREKRQEKNAPL